jgi:hypothetical protein
MILGMSSPEMNLRSFPNPVKNITSIKYSVDATSQVKIAAFDMQGKLIKVLVDKNKSKEHSKQILISAILRRVLI